jgi:hypothetical protein
MDQERAQITIASLANAEHHGVATAGAMARDQAEIGSQFAPAFEFLGVAHRGGECNCS